MTDNQPGVFQLSLFPRLVPHEVPDTLTKAALAGNIWVLPIDMADMMGYKFLDMTVRERGWND